MENRTQTQGLRTRWRRFARDNRMRWRLGDSLVELSDFEFTERCLWSHSSVIQPYSRENFECLAFWEKERGRSNRFRILLFMLSHDCWLNNSDYQNRFRSWRSSRRCSQNRSRSWIIMTIKTDFVYLFVLVDWIIQTIKTDFGVGEAPEDAHPEEESSARRHPK